MCMRICACVCVCVCVCVCGEDREGGCPIAKLNYKILNNDITGIAANAKVLFPFLKHTYTGKGHQKVGGGLCHLL